MTNTHPLLSCEGPICNSGFSAADREAQLASNSGAQTIRDEFAHTARGYVSKQLAVRPHTRVGVTTRGGVTVTLFACSVCGCSRVYGNSAWGM